MPLDAIGGIFLIFAAVIAHAATEAGPNRINPIAVVLTVAGLYLIYNGYSGYPSYLQPWVPYF